MSPFSRRVFLQTCGAFAVALRDSRSLRGALNAPLVLKDPRKLVDVNSTSIRAAIDLGCQAMSGLFNPDDHQVGAPYFWVNLRPSTSVSFNELFSDAQVPGKSLLGLLAAENIGVRVDRTAVEHYSRVAFFSYSGPVALPLNRSAVDGKLANFAPVNVAHGFHALYALVAFRNSERAHELAEASIAAVSALWDDRKGWDRLALEGRLGLRYRDVQPDAPFIAGLAMAIGPLAKYYRATGSPGAFHLATRLKEKVLAEYFVPSGEYDPTRLGAHVQNVVYVMASLAWLATVTHDASLMARVKAFYDNGLRRIRNSIGWSPEYFGSPAHVTGARGTNADRGEAGNTALILETALLLGEWGYYDAFADAELILRSHLLPTQLRDASCIGQSPPQRATNGHLDVARRARGTWGFPAPYGHLPFGDKIIGVGTDIVGPVVYALAEAHARIIGRHDGQLAIQLLFDYKSDDVDVESRYTDAALTLAVRTSKPLMVRIPRWVAAESVKFIGIARESAAFAGDYLNVPQGVAANGRFEVSFALATRELDLSYGGRTLRARARGDQVVAMDNRGTDCTLFDTYST